ncbi:MAG TPA: histidine kinase [Sphingomicrobium sp.]|nr:histidine kinase [Sphingomicrobium sp.]
MLRFLAGVAACFLLMTGAFLIWQSRAERAPALPPAPAPRAIAASAAEEDAVFRAPEATPKSREEKRFSRADKNKNGRIEMEELLAPRRKAFAKLDTNGNGVLSFDEWAVKTISKFKGADRDRNGWLTRAEYATTAPPPPKKKSCNCAPVARKAAVKTPVANDAADDSDD